MSDSKDPVDPSIRRVVSKLIADGVILSADHLATIDSTNTQSSRWLGKSVLDDSLLPRLVIADEQTSGRGRMGRSWNARNDGLALSLVWPGCHGLTSIAVGVAIAETIEFLAAPTKCGLKWPNDVWLADRKVAGVLIERVDTKSASGSRDGGTSGAVVDQPVSIVGIGLNVGSSPKLGESPTTSIAESTGKLVSRAEVLAELIPMLVERLRAVELDAEELLREFRRRCVLSSLPVHCFVDGQPVEGVCEGISDTGELQVLTANGIQKCRSGEVSRVRPRRPLSPN